VRTEGGSQPTHVQANQTEEKGVDGEAEVQDIDEEQSVEVRGKRVRCLGVGHVPDCAEPEEHAAHGPAPGTDQADNQQRCADKQCHQVLASRLGHPGGRVSVEPRHQEARPRGKRDERNEGKR
jgi:hypothetical protein